MTQQAQFSPEVVIQELKKHGGEQIRADLGLNTGVRYQGL